MKCKLLIFYLLLSVFSACRVHNVSIDKQTVLENDQFLVDLDERLTEIKKLHHSAAIDTAIYGQQEQVLNNLLDRAIIRQRHFRKYNALKSNALSRIEERKTISELEKLLPSYDQAIHRDKKLFEEMSSQPARNMQPPSTANIKMHQVAKKAYFDTDMYLIPYSIKQQAMEVYIPMVDSLFMAAQENEENPLPARIYIQGYADESPIADSSEITSVALTSTVNLSSPYIC